MSTRTIYQCDVCKETISVDQIPHAQPTAYHLLLTQGMTQHGRWDVCESCAKEGFQVRCTKDGFTIGPT